MVVAAAQPESDWVAPVNATAHAIETDHVEAIEILRIPDDVLFRVNVNPERLERWWRYKFVIRDVGIRAQELTAALKSMTAQPSGTQLESLEVRWGIVFYSKTSEGHRIVSLYFDRNGRAGAINSLPVSFGAEFFARLKKALHLSLE